MRLHAQRLPGGLQDAELALELRAQLIDTTPWAPQVSPLHSDASSSGVFTSDAYVVRATLGSARGLLS